MKSFALYHLAPATDLTQAQHELADQLRGGAYAGWTEAGRWVELLFNAGCYRYAEDVDADSAEHAVTLACSPDAKPRPFTIGDIASRPYIASYVQLRDGLYQLGLVCSCHKTLLSDSTNHCRACGRTY